MYSFIYGMMVCGSCLLLILSIAIVTATFNDKFDPMGCHGRQGLDHHDSASPYVLTSNLSSTDATQHPAAHSFPAPGFISAKGSSSQYADQGLIDQVLHLGKFIDDEFLVTSLLSELESTGGVKLLRDLALRTRTFEKAFKAWEHLHSLQQNGIARQQSIIPRLWASDLLDRKRAIQTYDEFRVFIQGLANKLFPWTAPYHADLRSLRASFAGRGLVFTAGDEHASYLLTSIPAVRALGCHLPIEVMYLGDDDLNEENRKLLDALPNVVTRDMSQMIDDSGWKLRGWAAKPFAILYSSFCEIIFVDADALFFQDPHHLFADDDYSRTGALFFRDRKLSPEDKRSLLRAALPKPISRGVKTNGWWTGETGHVQDSGVVVLDKRRHFVELLLTARLNGPDRDADRATGKKGIYELMYGDKETFWLSWEMAGSEDYAFHKGAVGNMGAITKSSLFTQGDEHDEQDEDELHEDEEDTDDQGKQPRKPSSIGSPATICSSQLLHFDIRGNPLWFNGWLATSKFENQRYKRFASLMKEPNGSGSPWTLKNSNIACLKSADYRGFSAEEQEIVDELVVSAEEISRSA